MIDLKLCVDCGERPAIVCDECRRALALLDHPYGFASIARHPEAGTDCRLCHQGTSTLCVDCLVGDVAAMRSDRDGPYRPVALDEFTRHEDELAILRKRLKDAGTEADW